MFRGPKGVVQTRSVGQSPMQSCAKGSELCQRHHGASRLARRLGSGDWVLARSTIGKGIIKNYQKHGIGKNKLNRLNQKYRNPEKSTKFRMESTIQNDKIENRLRNDKIWIIIEFDKKWKGIKIKQSPEQTIQNNKTRSRIKLTKPGMQ